MADDRIFVGSGKEHKYGVNVSVCLSDLPKEHIFEYNGKKYIKLKVNKKREADDYGKTHYVEVDTWKPDTENRVEVKEEDEDLPF